MREKRARVRSDIGIGDHCLCHSTDSPGFEPNALGLNFLSSKGIQRFETSLPVPTSVTVAIEQVTEYSEVCIPEDFNAEDTT